MDFKEKSVNLYTLILKDLVMETSRLNPEAVRYLSFTSGLIDELGIYDEVLENLIKNMTPEEIEAFKKFEQDLEGWLEGKEVDKNE